MACFLACFGYTKKRKRLKIISPNQVHGKYVPLDSDIISELPRAQNLKSSGSEKKEKTKEQSSLKVKKKVRFNLDVKTYEPLNYDDEMDNADFSEETKWEFNEEETQRASMVGWHHQKHKAINFRYQNIQDFYDEEDEITVEDNDLDDVIFDDEDWSDDFDNDNDDDDDDDDDDETIINDHQESEGTMGNLMSSNTLAYEEMRREDSNQNARQRNRYGCSVLKPVENLAQWKSIKAKDNLQRKRQRGTIITEQENKST